MTTILNGSTAPVPPATEMNLYVFNYAGTFWGYDLADGGTDLIVGGNGATELEALADAAGKLHAMGYRNLVLSPR